MKKREHTSHRRGAGILPSALLLLASASCSTAPAGVQLSGDRIVVTATLGSGEDSAQRMTKTPVITADVFEDYTIWLSAYLIDDTNPLNNGDYFVGEAFTYNDTGNAWECNKDRYWPLSGEMKFLAVAADADILDLSACTTWGEGRGVDGLSVDVPSTASTATEIMYARSNVNARSHEVCLNFYHTQMLLDFNFTTTHDDVIRIDDIIIDDVLTYGRLLVTNNAFLQAQWDLSLTDYSSCHVPEIEDGFIGTAERGFHAVLPAQQPGEITVKYSIRGSVDDPWSMAMPFEFSFNPGTHSWITGKKYTYNIFIDLTTFTVTPSVSDWDTVTRSETL